MANYRQKGSRNPNRPVATWVDSDAEALNLRGEIIYRRIVVGTVAISKFVALAPPQNFIRRIHDPDTYILIESAVADAAKRDMR